MALLAVPAAGFLSFIVAVMIAGKIDDIFKDRWARKRIDLVSALFCFVLLGSSEYTMAAFDGFSFGTAAALHLAIGLLFVAIALLGFDTYWESFIFATILSILMSFLVPAVVKARKVREHKSQSVKYRLPNLADPQSMHCGTSVHGAPRQHDGREVADMRFQYDCHSPLSHQNLQCLIRGAARVGLALVRVLSALRIKRVELGPFYGR